MANYRNPKTDQEFTTGQLVFGVGMTFFLMVVLAGAVAAVPAFLGLVTVAAWLWGSLSLLSALLMVSTTVEIVKTMKIDD